MKHVTATTFHQKTFANGMLHASIFGATFVVFKTVARRGSG